MKQNRLYVDFHVLQTVPPSCVNRDDTGSPKTAIYGGVTRARVSSQAWKKAMRDMFRSEIFTLDELGFRTKKALAMVANEVKALTPEVDADKLAKKALEKAGLKIKDTGKGKESDKDTDALFFISSAQAKALAKLIVDDEGEDKAYKYAISSNPSVDMALFGRMVANDPSLNYDAAAQVAHGISTHAVQNEYDYFTAVDDCAPEDNAGAGHLGTIEFNSSTLYRYATVNIAELLRNIAKSEIANVVRGFGDAFVRSMPTGKQNTFANRTLPDMVYVTVRGDQPVYFGNAFEKPITAGLNGYIAASIEAFKAYIQKTYRDYTAAPDAAFAVGEEMSDTADVMPLSKLLDALAEYIDKAVNESEERQ